MTEPRTLPEGEVGARSHSWWGLIMGLVVIGTAVATLISSYLYLLVESELWPPEGVDHPALGYPVIATVVLALSMLPMRRAWPGTDRDRLRGAAAPIAVIVALGLGFLVLSLVDLFRVDFGPGDHAYGSVYFILVLLAWVLAAAGVLFGFLVLARVATSDEAYLPLLGVRSFVLYWGFVGLVWLGAFGTVYVVPYLGEGMAT